MTTQVNSTSSSQPATTTPSPGTAWPIPNFPAGGGFDSSIDSTQETTWNGQGYLDKLKNGLAQMTADPNPATIQGVMAYIVNLTSGQDPNVNVSDVEKFLNQNTDMGSMIETASLQGMESAFFLGYGSPSVTGEAGAQAYINAMQAALQAAGGTSPYATQLENALNGLDAQLPQFASEHTDTSGTVTGTVGALYWSFGGATYTWAPGVDPTNPSNDNFMIWNIIQDEGPNGTPNPFFAELSNSFNSMETNWRMTALLQLLAAFNDPSLAISLWVGGAYDNQYQSEESQLGATTNVLTTQTNSYATPLLQDIKSFGNLTATTDASGAQSFVSTLLNWNNYVGLNPNSASIASSIQTNTVQAILNTQISNPMAATPPTPAAPATISLATFLQNISAGTAGYSWTALGASLNALAAPVPTSPSTYNPNVPLQGGTQPGYLAMINAAQAGGTLVSETSQQTATNLQQISDQDNSAISLMKSASDPQGAGIVALLTGIVQNERSSGG